ncbi:uncharacterized protein F5Z01DRAFT_678559 [Emericellopsis atlantica]|uniref:Uncharacterized protein n=1 Tax=Emericellopsis atlantica TaxID=2614577 RepID=A0A9P8CK10_9HYPO|nr:uncharacterized protein F5Z01DRAFT_678559 [Emericellopsis atlantica]KAG9249567.1 hypothetical protein F5Z01DRAFT_678559 [Emericellopsis atlantica]
MQFARKGLGDDEADEAASQRARGGSRQLTRPGQLQPPVCSHAGDDEDQISTVLSKVCEEYMHHKGEMTFGCILHAGALGTYSTAGSYAKARYRWYRSVEVCRRPRRRGPWRIVVRSTHEALLQQIDGRADLRQLHVRARSSGSPSNKVALCPRAMMANKADVQEFLQSLMPLVFISLMPPLRAAEFLSIIDTNSSTRRRSSSSCPRSSRSSSRCGYVSSGRHGVMLSYCRLGPRNPL